MGFVSVSSHTWLCLGDALLAELEAEKEAEDKKKESKKGKKKKKKGKGRAGSSQAHGEAAGEADLAEVDAEVAAPEAEKEAGVPVRCLGETTARLSVVPEGQALEEPSPEIGAAAPADFAESFAPPSDSPSQLAAAAPDEDLIGPEDPSSGPVPDDAVSGEPQPAAATVSLADADFDTGRAVVPESTLGGETTCIVCFTRPKTHIAVPCGHQCACGACADRMRDCPYCREPVMMWMLQRLV